MKILAIDTSTRFLCLGIYNDGRIYEYTLDTGRQLSSLLAVTIKRAIGALDLAIDDFDYFACGLGPGSFTGSRIGLALIKGLSYAAKKPVIGISTLDIIGLNAAGNFPQAQIVPIIDAKRSLVYCAVYNSKAGRLNRIKPYMLLDEGGLLEVIKAHSVILGDAAAIYKEKLTKNIKGLVILDSDFWYPRPRNIVHSALERIKKNKFDNPFDIKPLYLYPKECQIKKNSV